MLLWRVETELTYSWVWKSDRGVRANEQISVVQGAALEASGAMAGSGATTPTLGEAPALDERDLEPRTPMKRLGSTRKLAAFN
ncbi:jg25680, partial [Pararge aegeria aegeria]